MNNGEDENSNPDLPRLKEIRFLHQKYIEGFYLKVIEVNEATNISDEDLNKLHALK